MQENENDIIEVQVRELITTRFNVVTGMAEYFEETEKAYKPITDRIEKNVLRVLRAQGHKVGINTVRNIILSDFSESYNPFNDYFNSLPEWNKETDYIKQLCDVVDVKNGQYWNDWVKKWIVGIVASVLSDTEINQQFLALAGGQGIGKTTFLEYLVPSSLLDYSTTGYSNPENKDAQIQASECMIVNIDELAGMKTKHIEGFKQLLTQKKMRVRRPYGVNPENLKRRASFCGSTNEEQFLIDYTGNRRFLSFALNDIDLDTLPNINIDLVYAQALSLYNDNFQYWFNKSENKLIEENNKGFVVVSDIDEAIIETFEIVSRDSGESYIPMTATSVMTTLAGFGLISNNSRSAQLVGKALTKLGFEKFRSNGNSLYVLKLRD